MYDRKITHTQPANVAMDSVSKLRNPNLRDQLKKRQKYAEAISKEFALDNGEFNLKTQYKQLKWDTALDSKLSDEALDSNEKSWNLREYSADSETGSIKYKNIHRMTLNKGVGVRSAESAFDSVTGKRELQPMLYGDYDELESFAMDSVGLNPSAQGTMNTLQIFYYLYRNRAFNILVRKTAGIELMGESIQVADYTMKSIVLFFKQPVGNNAVAYPLVDGSTEGEVGLLLNTHSVPIFNIQQRVVVGDYEQAVLSKAGLALYAELTEVVTTNFNLFRDTFLLSGYLPAGSNGLYQWLDNTEDGLVDLPFPDTDYGEYTAAATYYNFVSILRKFVKRLKGWASVLSNQLRVDIAMPPERETMFLALFESLPLSVQNVIKSNFNFRFVAWAALSSEFNGLGKDIMICIARPNIEGQPIAWEFFTNLFFSTGTLRGEDTTSTKFGMSYTGAVVAFADCIQGYYFP